MPKARKIPFGLADITVGEGAEAIKFDGKEYLQAEGGQLTLEPILKEIQIADFGDSIYDELLDGFTGELTIVGAEEDLKILEMAMGYASPIADARTGDTVGLTDGRMGSSMRAKAKKVVIHPRIMGTDKSLDITIYKMGGVSAFNKEFGNEQGNRTITLKMYPRDGFDSNKVGNFFYVGETDPNARR